MPEIEDIQYLTTLDQVHTLADPLRIRIVDRLVREPMTVKMLGTNLGEPPAKVHYHVRELERIGVIHLVETREKGGVLEKYYRAVARSVSVQPDLLRTSPPDEFSAVMNDYVQLVQRGLVAALKHHRDNPDENLPMYINGSSVWATSDEARVLMEQISKLIESYQNPRSVPGEREWTLNVIGHLTVPEPEAEEATKIQHAPTKTGSLTFNVDFGAEEATKVRRAYTVGATFYAKKDLDAVVAEGYRLDLTVIGTCFFADDITTDQADSAIARLRVYGLLHARPEVRAVLQQKQSARDVRPASPSTVIRPVKTVQSMLERKQRDTQEEK